MFYFCDGCKKEQDKKDIDVFYKGVEEFHYCQTCEIPEDLSVFPQSSCPRNDMVFEDTWNRQPEKIIIVPHEEKPQFFKIPYDDLRKYMTFIKETWMKSVDIPHEEYMMEFGGLPAHYIAPFVPYSFVENRPEVKDINLESMYCSRT